MIFKFLGSIFVFLTSIHIGLSLKNRIKVKISALKEMVGMLETFKLRFEYEQITITKLLEYLSEDKNKETGVFADLCLNELKNGESIKNAWKKAARDFSNRNGIGEASEKKLIDFADNLGNTALNGQLSSIDLYITEFEKDIKLAEKELNENGKVLMSCSVFGGLVLIIILL